MSHWNEDDNNRGLYSKFVLAHADGSPIDPAARYIVLRYDNDPAAQAALLVFAYHIQDKNPQFANELQVEVLGFMDGGGEPIPVTHPSRHQQ